jgi:polysaccharide export outer membrane protein
MKTNINQGRLKITGLIVAFLLSAGFANAFGQSLSQAFKKGDALRLMIWQPYRISDGKNQSLDINGDYPIDSRGYVFFPIIGEVKVVGSTITTLADELKEKLSAYFQEPVVVVEPLIRVTLIGAFRRPGTYLISPEASLWELVDLGGGPDEKSNLKKMAVERGGKVIKKNILGGFERAYSLQEMGIMSGDQVVMPAQKPFRVRDAFEIVRFGITLLNLYFVISKF